MKPTNKWLNINLSGLKLKSITTWFSDGNKNFNEEWTLFVNVSRNNQAYSNISKEHSYKPLFFIVYSLEKSILSNKRNAKGTIIMFS